MDRWLNDTPESKRVCPLREKSCCAVTFDSYRQMLAHCRQKHPDKPPFGGDPTTELVMMDNQGRVLSWEEVGRMLDHPFGTARKEPFCRGRKWREAARDGQALKGPT